MLTTTTRGILTAFSSYLRLTYSPLPVDEERIRQMAEAGLTRLPEDWRYTLDRPLPPEELKAAINKGNGNTAPESDGIGLGLFKATWDALKDDWHDLFSHMFATSNLTEQKRGVIICIHNTARLTNRPTTTDYAAQH
jgi:hypothetical protein